MKQTAIRLSAALLAGILLSGALLPAFAEETRPTEPEVILETTAPETLPPETVIVETAAKESIPPETISEETAPPQTLPPETAPEETIPAETIPPAVTEAPESESRTTATEAWNFYFGLLHGHSTGSQTPEEIFSLAASRLDFYALTERTAYFESRPEAWEAGLSAAEGWTGEAFLPLWGYEFTFPSNLKIGHITTFGLDSWIPYEEGTHRKASDYYDTLPQGTFGQFSHPDSRQTFSRFAYEAKYDGKMPLLELTEAEGILDISQYVTALNKGWHLAPTAAPEECYVNNIEETSMRTVILAEELTKEALFDAIGNRRVYASQDADLEIYFRAGETLMGSTAAQRPWELTVTLCDPTDPDGDPGSGRVEVVDDSGRAISREVYSDGEVTLYLPIPSENDSGWYFLYITQPDGDTAVTAPIWVRETYSDFGVEAFSADPAQAAAGEEVRLRVTLFNHEQQALTLDTMILTGNGEALFTAAEPVTIPAGETYTLEIPCTRETAGTVALLFTAKGSMAGQEVTITSEVLTISFLPPATPSRSAIGDIRREELLGQTALVEGFVTAGNSDPRTSFPDRIYLQESTGGIALAGYPEVGLEAGTHLWVLGIVTLVEENYVLSYLDHGLTTTQAQKIDPKTSAIQAILDYEENGGSLMQAVGTVVNRTLTADGKGLSRLTLRDKGGDYLTVIIEEGILSATYGTNELAKTIRTGRRIRVRGLVHRLEGETVLRVRNCDEVVYTPPKQTLPDDTNPKTGDLGGLWLTLLLTSGTGIAALRRRRKK